MAVSFSSAHRWCAPIALLVCAEQAQAVDIWGYLSKYQIGVDYTSVHDDVVVSYEADRIDGIDDHCAPASDSAMSCYVYMGVGKSSDYGFILQQAFRRQGFFYFSADVSFGMRYLEAAFRRTEKTPVESPMDRVSYSLLAAIAKPYVQVGVTPAQTWPDILLSLGPAVQVAGGSVRVNDERANVVTGTRSSLLGGFFELELVFWRFGDGAFSLFSSRDSTSADAGTKFFPRDVDGMRDIRANFHRDVGGDLPFSMGAKLVLNWP